MIVPLSWLKEYVDITLTPQKLGEKLTEVGLSVEKITKVENDIIFELEITPNRPDLLSVIGIAREIVAIEGNLLADRQEKIKLPSLPNFPKSKKILPLTITTDSKINPRFTGVVIDCVKVKESPEWLKERLKKIGQRPINNIVDITNYVMLELGNPIHAFDYDKIKGQQMVVSLAKGGEEFISVDGLKYHLPKGAVIIRDSEKIIDLCGIKGGYNSGTFEGTKTIFIRVPVEIPHLIRRTSQGLGLRSEASSIFERGVNKGGTIDALKRCVDLILEIAGGKIASELYDLKEESFKPRKLKLNLDRQSKILGIDIPKEMVLSILKNLNLSPKSLAQDTIECTIPMYRNDLKIEEDLIEEVARLYGYNNFPKTLPEGQIPVAKIPYFRNYKLEEKAKNILLASGFSEIYSYSLIGEKELIDERINPEVVLRVDNPVSREFEYLRPTLAINLKKALLQNKPNFKEINLFELGKVYKGSNLSEAKEIFFLAGISNSKNYYEIKGILNKIFEEFGVKSDTASFIQILPEGILFEFNFSQVLEKADFQKKFVPLPKYPPIIEDLAIIVREAVKTGEIIESIKKQSLLIVNVSLLDQFKDTRTFHIVYQSKEKNLTNEDTAQIRKKVLTILKERFKAKLKE